MNLYNCTTIVPKGVCGLIFCSITHTPQPSRAIGENRHTVVCIVSLKTLEPEKDLEPHQLQHDLSMSCNQSGQHLQQEETTNQFLAVARLSINTSYIVCHLLSQQSERTSSWVVNQKFKGSWECHFSFWVHCKTISTAVFYLFM